MKTLNSKQKHDLLSCVTKNEMGLDYLKKSITDIDKLSKMILLLEDNNENLKKLIHELITNQD